MSVKDHLERFKNKYGTPKQNAKPDEISIDSGTNKANKTKKTTGGTRLQLSNLPNGNNGTIRIRGIVDDNNVDDITPILTSRGNVPTNKTFSMTNDLVKKYIAQYN